MPVKRVHIQDAQQGSCCGVKQMTQVSSDRFSVSYSNHHLELIGIGGHRERLNDARMVYVVWVGSSQACGFDSTRGRDFYLIEL